MYKKIIITLSAIIVLSLPFQQQYAESAILSKVASKGAQKIVKEVIKESAFDIAIDLFVNEAYDMALEEQAKYQAQQDYELFCGKKMPDLITCEKPMQVKKVLTETDKANIGNQAEIELDKLITNGKGFTRWQKFLDWFLPIWVASFALTAITYAIDPEVRSLFNEAGYNALVALGLIKPVIDTTQLLEPQEVGNDAPTPRTTTGTDDTLGYYSQSKINTTSGSYNMIITSPSTLSIPREKTLVIGTLINDIQRDRDSTSVFSNGLQLFGMNFSGNYYYVSPTTYDNSIQSLIIEKNGQEIFSKTTNFVGETIPLPTVALNDISPTIKSIRFRLPYEKGGFLYTDVLMFTVEGDYYHYQVKHLTTRIPTTITQIEYSNATQIPRGQENLTVMKDLKVYKTLTVPMYEEIEQDLQIPKTKYEDDNGQIALIPPSALPYTQTSTGLQLTPEIDETTGDQKFTTPTGESIPEDDITVGEPNIQDNPSPAPNTVTPPATSTNPNPEPIPLTPSTPPPPPPTPIETLPPVFPEGESCDVGLKLPRFMPLLHTISDAFPFSIPFDLKDGFDAIFAEMGSEKPEFNYKLNVMGEEHSWKITIPDYFDSWKTFTDSFLIFIFDVGIIYAIYRFMGGGN